MSMDRDEYRLREYENRAKVLQIAAYLVDDPVATVELGEILNNFCLGYYASALDQVKRLQEKYQHERRDNAPTADDTATAEQSEPPSASGSHPYTGPGNAVAIDDDRFIIGE